LSALGTKELKELGTTGCYESLIELTPRIALGIGSRLGLSSGRAANELLEVGKALAG
jgi:hypothetical protein